MMRSIFLALLFLFGFLAVESACAQSSEGSRFARWASSDASSLARDIARRAPYLIAGAALALGPLTRIDHVIWEKAQTIDSRTAHSFLDWTNEIGGPAAAPVVAGIFASTLLTRNRKLQNAAFTSLESLAYSSILSLSIKYSMGRVRPQDGTGPYHLKPFSGNSSFPSGHATAAFAILTPWVLYYPNAATYGLLVFSTGTAVARVARDKHWPTDVLVGGAIGFFTARYLVSHHGRERAEGTRLAFSLGISGFRLSYRL